MYLDQSHGFFSKRQVQINFTSQSLACMQCIDNKGFLSYIFYSVLLYTHVTDKVLTTDKLLNKVTTLKIARLSFGDVHVCTILVGSFLVVQKRSKNCLFVSFQHCLWLCILK